MPPKVRITKQEIVETAIELIRENGMDALNARAVAAVLNCSTQPVFSNFQTMEELFDEVIKTAYGMYFGYLEREAKNGKYPQYKSFGMAYIRFAKEEKELFKLLFMRDRGGEGITPTPDFTASVDMIVSTNGLDREKAELMHLEMWACVHGIGAMIATSFFEPDWKIIENMLTDVYQGLRSQHLSEG